MNLTHRTFLAAVVLAVAGWTALPTAHAQEAQPQSEVASKIAQFAPLNRVAREYKEANLATDLEGARKLLGKPATFKGSVVQVLAPDDSAVFLHFAEDPKSGLVVVVQKENFKRFPKLEELKGKEVVFTSKVVESAGRLGVVLVRPGQLKIVR